jgi:hypothetical protein
VRREDAGTPSRRTIIDAFQSKKKRMPERHSKQGCQVLKVKRFEYDENSLTPYDSFVTLRAPGPQ